MATDPFLLARTTARALSGAARLPLAQQSPDEPPSLTEVVDSLKSLGRGFLTGLPRVGLALLVLAVFVFGGRLFRASLERRMGRLRTATFAQVFSGLAYAGVLIVGLVVALPIAFPQVSLAHTLGGLSLLTVAAGFAFQDILSNLLAGILLVFRQPFVVGDQVTVKDHEGMVEAITIRETRLRTADGRLIIIPNKDVYQNPIEVESRYDAVRTTLFLNVDGQADLAGARQLALDAAGAVEGVREDPQPEAHYSDVDTTRVTLRLLYWTRAHQPEIASVEEQVLEAVTKAHRGAGIESDVRRRDGRGLKETLTRVVPSRVEGSLVHRDRE